MTENSTLDSLEIKRRLTIGVCTYRRFPSLKKCLDSLENQTLERSQFKIIVVDNSHMEKSYSFSNSLKISDRFEYIISNEHGISNARNKVLERCDTPYLAYIDDDAIADPVWAEAILRVFENSDCSVGIVGGPVEPNWEIERPDWVKGRLLHPYAVVDWGEEQRVINGFNQWLAAANVAYKTSVLRRINGFPRHLGRRGKLLTCHEELWAHKQCRKLGYLLVYSPEIKVKHLVQKERLTINWICRDAFWEGVSHKIVDHEIEDESALDENVIERLEKKVEELFEDENVKEETEDILRVTAKFNSAGKKFVEDNFSDLIQKRNQDSQRQVFIVTPCKNSVESIDMTIMSVLSQQGDFFIHYHVQDGGSVDGTVNRLKDWKKILDKGEFPLFCNGVSFTWISEPDEGVYSAINKAFSLYDIPENAAMTWINSDDHLYQGAVSNAVELFCQEDRVEWITGATDVSDNTGKKIGFHADGYPRRLIEEGICDGKNWRVIQQEGTFWRKRLWDKVGGLNERYRLVGDWDLWRRFANHKELYFFPWSVGSFQLREGQLSGEKGGYFEDMDGILPAIDRDRRLRELSGRKEIFEYFNVTPDYRSKSFTIEKKMTINWPENNKMDSAIRHDKIFSNNEKNEIDLDNNHIESARPKVRIRQSGPAHKNGRSYSKELFYFLRLIRYWFRIQNSRLFFNSYYLHRYPDVKESRIPPLLHYILFGADEGRDPNPLFCSRWYLNKYSDIVVNEMNPLFHYIKFGWKEGRDPGPEFSTKAYLNYHRDIVASGTNPLKHYLTHGITEDRLIKKSQIHTP